MKRRQQTGYYLTLLALMMLVGGYLLTSLPSFSQHPLRAFVGLALTVLPLLLYGLRAIKRDLRAFQVLALLAPVYLFVAGVVWLWASPLWGAWFVFAAILLEIGAILHNYAPRRKKSDLSSD